MTNSKQWTYTIAAADAGLFDLSCPKASVESSIARLPHTKKHYRRSILGNAGAVWSCGQGHKLDAQAIKPIWRRATESQNVYASHETG